MKVKVKVGNISQFHEARYCAGMGVDWIGFRDITPESFAEMAGWLAGPQFALEVENIPFTLINNTVLEMPMAEIERAQGETAVRLQVSEWEKYKHELWARKDSIQYAQLQLSTDERENRKVVKEMQLTTKIYLLVEEAERLDYYLSLKTEGLALRGGMKEDYSPLSTILEQLQED